jgi:tryptophan halogenase
MESKKIVVLGGGTAGWLTALMAKRIMPESEVVVVASEEIGILGAGEGTTIQIVRIMDFLGIPVSDIVKEASATIKNGIKFTNWTKDQDYFYHGFAPNDHQQVGELLSTFGSHNISYMLNTLEDIDKKEFDFCSVYSDKNKVPFYPTVSENLSFYKDITDYVNVATFALHFDARRLAAMLEKYAISRNITRIEGKVLEVTSKDNGDIASLILESGSSVEGDFFFDCSGFKRLLIGKHYNAVWKSHSDLLTVNKAIPFFIKYEDGEEPVPYTESIAMKYGWMWKIPVEFRYGCGYVYDSSYISKEEAIKEVEDLLGRKIEVPTTFSFEAGYYENPWINNCVAVGLSSGFIEPLEATSILVSILSLQNVLDSVGSMFERPQDYIENYNKKMSSYNEDISNFIYFHYMGGRDDTPFWKKFQDADVAPEYVKKVISEWENSIPTQGQFTANLFPYMSWYQVAYGLNLINKEVVDNITKTSGYENHLAHFNANKAMALSESNKMIDHKEFLVNMRNSPHTTLPR